jgi:BOP1NT (NUC169) domain
MLDIADDHTFLHMNLLYLTLPYFTLLYPSLLHSTLPTGHAESYNPPKEYILTPDELAKMEDQDPKDRAYNFVPKTHDCLRRVSGTATALHYCAVLCCSPLPCNSVFRNLLFPLKTVPENSLSFPRRFIFYDWSAPVASLHTS